MAVLGLRLAPVPLPVPRLGTSFLDPGLSFALPPVPIPLATGTGYLHLTVPSSPTLVGVVLYFQALIGNNTTGEARFTGYTVDAVR